MALQRFLPDVARTRRAVGWVLIAIFAFPLFWILEIVAPGHPNGTAIVFFLLIAGMMALGLRLAFWPGEYLEIDLEARTFNVIRKGTKIAAGPLDSLGPLEIVRRSREVGSGSRRSTIVRYAVHAAVHSKIDLYEMKTSGRARQKMEGLARGWGLPSRSWGGAVRLPEALDTPLHERLRGDSAARKPTLLHPEWGVRIEPIASGYALVSTYRSWEPLQTSAVFLVVCLFILRGANPFDSMELLRNGDPMTLVFAGLFGIVILVMLSFVFKGVRDTFFPGTVRIDERGVSYRWRSMTFKRIEEVTATAPIEIVGDRRTLQLGETFCPRAAVDSVVHELQRLIIDVAASHADGA